MVAYKDIKPLVRNLARGILMPNYDLKLKVKFHASPAARVIAACAAALNLPAGIKFHQDQ